MIDHYKPAGIVLIAIYSGLFALAGLPMGCTVAFVGLPGASVMVLVGSLLASLAVFMLAAAYALWTLQAWGRAYTWWLYLACIPLGLMAIFPVFPGQQMSAGNTALQVIGIAIDLPDASRRSRIGSSSARLAVASGTRPPSFCCWM